MKILVCDRIGEPGLTFLREKGHEVLFRPDITAEELPGVAASADALVVRGRTKVTKGVIDAAKNLRVIARSGTGVDNIDRIEAGKRSIVVVNAPGANSESVAEHVVACMLIMARGLVPIISEFKKGTWRKSVFTASELKGKTLGVIGFGHVGSRVAELGKAFDMNVLIYRRGDKLVDILPQCDFVSLHVPLIDETRGLVGKKELAMMKKTAFLINTARGPVVDEEALLAALQNKTIAGAALDVFWIEPLPASSPFLKLDNVILTPHVGADSREAEDRASLMISEDIDRVLSGKKPIHQVI